LSFIHVNAIIGGVFPVNELTTSLLAPFIERVP